MFYPSAQYGSGAGRREIRTAGVRMFLNQASAPLQFCLHISGGSPSNLSKLRLAQLSGAAPRCKQVLALGSSASTVLASENLESTRRGRHPLMCAPHVICAVLRHANPRPCAPPRLSRTAGSRLCRPTDIHALDRSRSSTWPYHLPLPPLCRLHHVCRSAA